jgi:hypothetical protein
MFKRRTLFVLGAGASAEVDFPLGSQLAKAIGNKLDIRFEGGTSGWNLTLGAGV